MNSKKGTSIVTDWSLKQKDSYNEKRPINTLEIFWQNEIVVKTVWVLPFNDDKTINVKGIEEISTNIAI